MFLFSSSFPAFPSSFRLYKYFKTHQLSLRKRKKWRVHWCAEEKRGQKWTGQCTREHPWAQSIFDRVSDRSSGHIFSFWTRFLGGRNRIFAYNCLCMCSEKYLLVHRFQCWMMSNSRLFQSLLLSLALSNTTCKSVSRDENINTVVIGQPLEDPNSTLFNGLSSFSILENCV